MEPFSHASHRPAHTYTHLHLPSQGRPVNLPSQCNTRLVQFLPQDIPILTTPLLPLAIVLHIGPIKFPQGVRRSPLQCVNTLVRKIGLTPIVHPLINPWVVLKLFLSPTCRTLVSNRLNRACNPRQLPTPIHAPLLPPITLIILLVVFPLNAYCVTSRWPCTRVLLITPFNLTWINRATRLPTTQAQHLVPKVLLLGASFNLITPLLGRQHKLNKLVCVLLTADLHVPKVLRLIFGNNRLELRFKYLRKLARKLFARLVHPPTYLPLLVL